MVDIPFAYNVILRCLVLNFHDIVINIGYLCLKLLAQEGVAIDRGNQKYAQEYYRHSTKDLGKITMPLLEKLEFHTKPEPTSPVKEIELEADKKVCFGTILNNGIKRDIVNLLKSRIMTFA